MAPLFTISMFQKNVICNHLTPLKIGWTTNLEEKVHTCLEKLVFFTAQQYQDETHDSFYWERKGQFI